MSHAPNAGHRAASRCITALQLTSRLRLGTISPPEGRSIEGGGLVKGRLGGNQVVGMGGEVGRGGGGQWVRVKRDGGTGAMMEGVEGRGGRVAGSLHLNRQ